MTKKRCIYCFYFSNYVDFKSWPRKKDNFAHSSRI